MAIRILNTRYDRFSVLVVLCLSVFQGSVRCRLLSLPKPDPNNAAASARWLISQNSWGVLNTISSDLGGAPFGNVVSYSDGLPDKGTGIPYFYLTALDPTARNGLKDPRASFTVSETTIGTCRKIDPETPTCSKITLTGKLKVVHSKSQEADFALKALFTKHPEMRGWPKSHNFQIFKLEIENIFLINNFGGPKPLTVEQYLRPKIFVEFRPSVIAASALKHALEDLYAAKSRTDDFTHLEKFVCLDEREDTTECQKLMEEHLRDPCFNSSSPFCVKSVHYRASPMSVLLNEKIHICDCRAGLSVFNTHHHRV